ncbi:unnamed protein product [Medioppia subpectinata]|uniref:Elongation of very long chain fatty acids protein n=1 Tax=Medioppia subpectinata TaxID=1979941 RepID=A0A7R9Q191_9ACAR|nr:unnamed protein product [Medioppia subpectinata]CAG2108066.1 unnamed protein product [Medioppia subpectinata]
MYEYNIMETLHEFECNFNTTGSHKWFVHNWHISVYLSIAYVCLIYGLKLWMRNKNAFKLNVYLFVWNTELAVFSTIGTFKLLDEMLYRLVNHGFDYSICSHIPYHTQGSGFWLFVFIFSKSFELFDTIFMVLRKKPVMLLHWYHHVTVLIFCWWSYSLIASTGMWFAFVNYTVHSFMYTYYALQSVGVRVPSALPKAITIGQILQMFFGLFITLMSFVLKFYGNGCGVSFEHIGVSIALYGSYFYLFYKYNKKCFRHILLNKMDRLYRYETNFNPYVWHQWMVNHWHISVYLSIAYLCLIYTLKLLMQNKNALKLNGYLFAWNILLTIFSIIGSFSICNQDYHTPTIGLWGFLFIMSKSVELLDTLFLVLKKRPVILLHWYHHVTVLIFCWWSYSLNASTARWFAFVNYTVHSFMYGYYALQSVQVKVPSALTKIITIGQIFQMFFGLFITLMSFWLKFYGNGCGVSFKHIAVSIALYGSYFYLFYRFFSDRYLKQNMDVINDLEINFNETEWIAWFVQNWHISVYVSIAYVCLIYSLKLWMKNKNGFNLNGYLFVWNTLLAVFSTIGTIRCGEEIYYRLVNYGFGYSICHKDLHTLRAGLWGLLFTLSKSIELLDTVFLVLRKKPVMFLHWYHHVTVLMFAWWTYSFMGSTGRWFAFVNYTVHSFMYSYYALQAVRVRVPSVLAKSITIVQILQMFFGLFITLMSFVLKFYGNGCGVSFEHIGVSLAIYGSCN